MIFTSWSVSSVLCQADLSVQVHKARTTSLTENCSCTVVSVAVLAAVSFLTLTYAVL